jgi:hypothetical protein
MTGNENSSDDGVEQIRALTRLLKAGVPPGAALQVVQSAAAARRAIIAANAPRDAS